MDGWKNDKFCRINDFINSCPSRAETGLKKLSSGLKVVFCRLFIIIQKSPLNKDSVRVKDLF